RMAFSRATSGIAGASGGPSGCPVSAMAPLAAQAGSACSAGPPWSVGATDAGGSPRPLGSACSAVPPPSVGSAGTAPLAGPAGAGRGSPPGEPWGGSARHRRAHTRPTVGGVPLQPLAVDAALALLEGLDPADLVEVFDTPMLVVGLDDADPASVRALAARRPP